MKHPIKAAIIFALLCIACAFIIVTVEQHFKPQGNGFVHESAFEIEKVAAGGEAGWQANSQKSSS